MEHQTPKQDDADFMIDLSHAGSVLPEGATDAPAAGPASDAGPRKRGPVEMRDIQEAIARVEAEAKANVAAESRAHAENRARTLAEQRAAMDAAAAAAALANAQASGDAIAANRDRLESLRAAAEASA